MRAHVLSLNLATVKGCQRQCLTAVRGFFACSLFELNFFSHFLCILLKSGIGRALDFFTFVVDFGITPLKQETKEYNSVLVKINTSKSINFLQANRYTYRHFHIRCLKFAGSRPKTYNEATCTTRQLLKNHKFHLPISIEIVIVLLGT